MKLVDANVILYATNRDAQHHEVSKRWLDAALSGQETVGFAWVVLLAFLRLSTKQAVFPRPLTIGQAADQVEAWLASPAGVVVHPGSDHLTSIQDKLNDLGVGGNMTTDAHLAALAIDNKAQLISFDTDFARFEDLDWAKPTPTNP